MIRFLQIYTGVLCPFFGIFDFCGKKRLRRLDNLATKNVGSVRLSGVK